MKATVLIGLLLSLLQLSCDYKPEDNKNNNIKPSPQLSDCNSSGTSQVDELAILLNKNKIATAEEERVSSLSGDFEKIQEATKITVTSKTYKGLISTCESTSFELNLDCSGKMTLLKNNEVISENNDDILKRRELFVKKATLCGSLELKQGETLFLYASDMTLNNFSIKLQENTLLSLSADSLKNSNELRDVRIDSKGALSIHIFKDLTQ